MNPETPDIFDTDLQQLFAGIVPDGGFEDRLVAALRPPRLRLVIPGPVAKAALAAAAMLAVGVTGYVGNQYILGGQRIAQDTLIQSVAAPSTQPSADSAWDYGGGSNSAMNWSEDKKGPVPVLSSHGIVSLRGDAEDGIKASDLAANGTAEKKIPFNDVLAYPTGWPKVAEMRDKEVPEGPKNAPTDLKSPPSNTGKANENFYLLKDGTKVVVDQNGDSADKKGTVPLPSSGGQSPSDKPQNNEIDSAKAQADTPSMQANREEEYQRDRGRTISNLIQDSRQYIDEGKYAEASAVIGNIQKLDPSNAFANSVKQYVDDKKNIVEQRKFRGMFDDQWTKQLNDANQRKVPYDDLVAYPPKWPAVADSRAENPNAASAATQPVFGDRKIIRTGTLEFEVERFDTAQNLIVKIVGELGGFVGGTDSQKLPNGKVMGSIVVHVPPERLDALVLSLRALGDLKSQQITAQDVTKDYTDAESELTADRAMEKRLLELISKGNGQVKDLLEAENQLGEWRAKIEKAEGMIRYYNAQVAMSTLTITLSEKDIQNPAAAVETETADMGIESDDVENARATAMKLIDNAKGRIISAELKRFDAGQLAAKLVADVPPESAGAVIDQLKLIGKVARLEIQRQQNTTGGGGDGSAAVTSVVPLRTERKPTRLLISIYNLANVAPRRTTNVNLAATDVEAAFAVLKKFAESNGGRVVTSNLDRNDAVRTTGSLVLEFPPAQLESAMTTLRDQGDVLKLTATENPDTQNSTEAKQGLTVTLVSLASVPARETIQQTLAAVDVAKAYQAVVDAVNSPQLTITNGAVSVTAMVPHSHGRVQSAQLNEQDRQNVTADLQLEIPRATEDDFDKALAAAGVSISRTSTQAMNTDNAVDSKVQVHLTITAADHLPARETTKLQIEVPDVDKAAGAAQALAIADGGRVLDSTISRDKGKGIARLVLDVPLEKAGEALQQLREAGTVRGIDSTRDPQAPSGQFAHAIIGVEFATGDAIVADQIGPWAAIRQGLSTSINGLLWSLQWIVVGLCLLGPWVLLSWGGLKLLRRRSRRATAAIS